ncbi:hypothetical protein TWF102_009734 [Orbilia oligospora]|uniref:Uncharacterized protein n=1 Tax=Orbilia oligospora TaxID=2813651 RepID=A0A7C8N5C4_ORBOL|nr:hypothetical protein TWF102_009734 [Orbilia oligospora]
MHLQTLLLPAATTLLLTLPPATQAWGFYGHKTVALLASRYFLPETAQFVQTYLYRGQSIMDAAVWADRYAHIPLGRYSKTWHYIDAQDDPPRPPVSDLPIDDERVVTANPQSLRIVYQRHDT